MRLQQVRPLYLAALAFILIACRSLAGGPDFEARNIHVDDVRPRPDQGWVIVLSGSGVLYLDKPGSPGQGQAVELVMKKTEITYTPDLLHAVRPDKSVTYAERLKSMIGKDLPEVQAWHVFATIEGGQLARMIVRHLVPFASTLDEAYYRLDDLDQLSTWDHTSGQPKAPEKKTE